MSEGYAKHSFQRILSRDTAQAKSYVTGDIRNHALIPFFRRHLPETGAHLGVDVGCGSGVLSWALATLCSKVKAIDQNQQNIQFASDLATERGLSNIEFSQGDAFALPCQNGEADIVVLNGVLEWVGVSQMGADPTHHQMRCLREAKRVIAKGGFLYLAIENRWAPCSIRSDPHVKLPLINALPRWMANLYMLMVRGRKYQTYIYGRRSLGRMLANAGFGIQKFFTVLPDYQYAFRFVSLESRKSVIEQLADVDVDELQRLCDEAGLNHDMQRVLQKHGRRARCGLFSLMVPTLCCVAFVDT